MNIGMKWVDLFLILVFNIWLLIGLRLFLQNLWCCFMFFTLTNHLLILFSLFLLNINFYKARNLNNDKIPNFKARLIFSNILFCYCHLFKVSNWNIRAMCEIRLKLTIKASERRFWLYSEEVLRIVLVFSIDGYEHVNVDLDRVNWI